LIKIHLNESEAFHAALAGIQRRLQGIFTLGRSDKHGFDGLGWDIDIEGAGAEIAACNALKIPWTHAVKIVADPSKLEGDIAPGVEVRHTVTHSNSLILHPEDKDDYSYLLVTGKMPNYVVRGWLKARDGKKDKYWRTDVREPAYFIPQSDLNLID